jgi:hypothetical protein
VQPEIRYEQQSVRTEVDARGLAYDFEAAFPLEDFPYLYAAPVMVAL